MASYLLQRIVNAFQSYWVGDETSQMDQDELDNNLNKACQDKKANSVQKLLSCGADVNRVDCDGYHPLLISAINGSEDVVKILLDKKGVLVNQKGFHGYTALMGAAQNGHRNIVKDLILAGADLELSDDDGNTALILATRCRHNDTAQILIEHGSNVHRIGFMKQSSLDIANEHQMRNVVALIELQQKLKTSVSTPNLRKKSSIKTATRKSIPTTLMDRAAASTTAQHLDPCNEEEPEFLPIVDDETKVTFTMMKEDDEDEDDGAGAANFS